MATVRELLTSAGSRIDRFDARVLLSAVLHCPKEKFISHPEMEVSPELMGRFLSDVDHVAEGFPVPYITGVQSFWSHDFKVTPDVLIPRPDTELLIEKALKVIEFRTHPAILEMGTGSGCIAVTIGIERRDAVITATDFSEPALLVAKENAATLGAENITFARGSWYEAVDANADAKYDLIVSNPPYIEPDDEHLPALRYEPITALTDGHDGLADLRSIINGAPAYLVAGGVLAVEHGYNQGEAVREIFSAAGFSAPETLKDYGGNDRLTWGALP